MPRTSSHHSNKPSSSLSSSRAFTLIELLVVIAIIGILSGIILVSLNGAKNKANDAVRQSDLHTMKTALELYANDHRGNYPSTITSGDTPDIYGLNNCSSWQGGSLTGRTDWIPELVQGGYIQKLPHDPNGLATYTSNTEDGCTNTYVYSSDGINYTLYNSLTIAATNPNASTTAFNNGGGNGGGNNGGNGGGGDPCLGTPNIGTVCLNGTVFVGLGYRTTPEDLEGLINVNTASDTCIAKGSGWRLPTKDELNDMFYANKNAIGGFNVSGNYPESHYWSSTGDGPSTAFYQRFSDGSSIFSINSSGEFLGVRCIWAN